MERILTHSKRRSKDLFTQQTRRLCQASTLWEHIYNDIIRNISRSNNILLFEQGNRLTTKIRSSCLNFFLFGKKILLLRKRPFGSASNLFGIKDLVTIEKNVCEGGYKDTLRAAARLNDGARTSIHLYTYDFSADEWDIPTRLFLSYLKHWKNSSYHLLFITADTPICLPSKSPPLSSEWEKEGSTLMLANK